ncbi:RNA helicase required for poly(A+) mRNA export [Coemansia sp. RSA 564]|nr:RNA helicase required for poly(A+) mRNA export [Coemansia sp. RSA 564]
MSVPRNQFSISLEDSDEVDSITDQVSQLNTDEKPKPDASENPKPDAIEHEVEVRLADLQADPDSPLYSVKSFDELGIHENLLKGVYEMNFTKPSKIQERALPLLLANPPRNMIGQSQSGTGKTAAFVLTMLSRVDYDIDQPQALCLAPSRELARQIMEVVEKMGKYTPMKTKYVIKDSVQKGEKITAHIVIGTPGTVSDMIRKRSLPLGAMKLFVLDEADNMLDQQGLGDQTLRIKKQVPKECQVVLFSATFPDNVREFTKRFAPEANEIRLKATELTVEGIKQFYMDCKSVEHKFEVLSELYSLMTVGQSIIFVRRRDTADKIALRLNNDGHAVVSLHGTMDTVKRDEVMDQFRRGEIKVLITTNVIARGIDIQQVNLVINYDIPLTGSNVPDPETYLHRIGRTGRFGRTGASINFVHDEMSYEQMQEIQNTLGCDIIKVPTDDWEVAHKILKKALNTGASSGIGEACAYQFAAAGANVTITARRMDRLDAVRSHIQAKWPNVQVHAAELDVCVQEQVEQVISNIPGDLANIDILVNNAGLAMGTDPVSDISNDAINIVIDTNIKGLLYVSQCVVRIMKRRKTGHIIMMGSIAGMQGYAMGSIYCATKSAVHAISESLRAETISVPIKVTEIKPGMVETEFSVVRFNGDKSKADGVYKGVEPMTAEDVAECVVFAASRHPRCVVSDVVMLATGQATAGLVHRK